MTDYTVSERYDFQPLRIRLWRRVRHEPRALWRFASQLFRWCVLGAPLSQQWHDLVGGSRWQAMCHIWTTERSLLHIRMGNYLTAEEFVAELRRRSEA